ncbi:MAG TPA: response regulator transcription factor, partial [Polyangiales bacterium]|nr:response regulator transcription factor [Polyangiales bacterium]
TSSFGKPPGDTRRTGPFARALVVDDDDALRRSIVRFLRGMRTEVAEARTLEEALRLLARGPDLVMTDVRLPDGSGCAVAEMASRLTPQPLVVAMSGLASASEAFALAQWGVRVYLTKPFAPSDLMDSVCELASAEAQGRPDGERVQPQTATSLAVSLALFAQRHAIPEREMALVRLAVAGVPRGRCPTMLGVSENTCKTLIRRLLQRCGARTLAEIPRLVLMRQPELEQ